jgi:tyrosine-protein phosphatase YwqE
MIQVNATSLTGRHGAEIEALAWELVDEDVVALVASDGHRATRPARLDAAYAAVHARVGETRARSLFDGSAVGVTVRDREPLRARPRSGRL